MTTHLTSTAPFEKESVQFTWLGRLGLFIFFLLCEAAIFIFGSHYKEIKSLLAGKKTMIIRGATIIWKVP